VAGEEFHDSHNKNAMGYKKVGNTYWMSRTVWEATEVQATMIALGSCTDKYAVSQRLLADTQMVADAKNEVALNLNKEREDAIRAAEVASSQHAEKVRGLTADLNEQRSAFENLVATHTKSQDALQKEKEALQSKMNADTAELRTQLEALRTQLKNQQSQHKDLQQTTARMTVMNTVSEGRIGELEAQVGALNDAHQDATELQAKLDQALADRAAWETTLRQSHAKEVAALQARSTEAETALKKCVDPTPEEEATKTATVQAEVALEVAVSNLEFNQRLGQDACSKLELCPGQDGKFEIQRKKGSTQRSACHERGCDDQNARETDGTWVKALPGGDRKGVKLICVKKCAKVAGDRAAVLAAERVAEEAAAKAERAARTSQNLATFSVGARLAKMAAKARATIEAEAQQIRLDASVAADSAEDMQNGPARVAAARKETATKNDEAAHEAGVQREAERATTTCDGVSGSTQYGGFIFKKWVDKLKKQAVQPEGQGCQNTQKARMAICNFYSDKPKIRLDEIVQLFEGKKVKCKGYADALKGLLGDVCKDITDNKTKLTVTLCDKRKMQ